MFSNMIGIQRLKWYTERNVLGKGIKELKFVKDTYLPLK